MLREAVRVNPQFANAHNNLGTVLKEKGDLVGAEEAYRTAIKIDPNYAIGSLQSGHCSLLRKGVLDAAETDLREAIRLNHAFHTKRTVISAAVLA